MAYDDDHDHFDRGEKVIVIVNDHSLKYHIRQ
jgi:hypothetical protein